MPRYSPLPSVSIDPRNEAQLVQDAAQKVYEASNRTLNDFSAGNPLAVLLEGQAFSQGEFLFWANQLPNKILIEWIGPFLGAMRRLGTPAIALVKLSISPRNSDLLVPAGSVFTSNSRLSGGQSFEYVSSFNVTIPAGKTEVEISVYSKYVGNAYNVPANSITSPPDLGEASAVVTNPEPAVGGSDVETYTQVQERFFSLIRRRNPVSQADWENFFIDLFGIGTLTSVQPNRSSKFGYNYLADYTKPNGQVSFFVLGPNGTELTEDQIRRGQNVINFSVPIENQAHLYPITLSQTQYNITLEVDANGVYGSNYQPVTLNFRDRIATVLSPGNVFPANTNPTVSDVDAAFYNTFDAASRFKDPQINYSAAYNTPALLSKEAAIFTNVYDFDPLDSILRGDDLIVVNNPNPTYYPVEVAYSPYSTSKFDQTIYGNLSLKQIKLLSPGKYNLGDIVSLGNQLFVVLENIVIGSSTDIPNAFAANKISSAKTYSAWIVDNSYQYSLGSTIDPEIIEYDYEGGEFKPTTTVGRLVWLVAKNFSLLPSTNDITGAQTQNKIGPALNSDLSNNLNELVEGQTYSPGTWVYTPQVGSGPDAISDPYYNYVDVTKGAVNKYAYVNASFTYGPSGSLTVDYFGELLTQGILKEVTVLDGNGGLPIYKYKPRFKCGQYLEYREVSGGQPTYCIATEYFTPNSTSILDLINDGHVINLAPSSELRSQLDNLVSGGISGRIKTTTLVSTGSGYPNGAFNNLPLAYVNPINGKGTNGSINLVVSGNTVVSYELSDFGKGYSDGDVLTVSNGFLGGVGGGLQIRVSSVYPHKTEINPFVRMFTFYKGDRTYFRNGNIVKSYTATSSVNPLFDFSIYYKNGIFIESSEAGINSFDPGVYVPYFNPEYVKFAEDTIIAEDGKNIYRVMRAFTPQTKITNWTGMEVSNTARFEEFAGSLLRYVSFYRCEEEIVSQFGLETSSIKLGSAQVTLVPRNSGRFLNSSQKITYLWENPGSTSESPQLSWYTGTTFPYQPPDYKEGTLSL
jgi:hypothetical protein